VLINPISYFITLKTRASYG